MHYKKDYFGFVYIWYDKKRKMFYIGSHMGHLEDGYICSSSRMNKAYKKRSNDFKRRILEYIVTDDSKEKYEKEQQWLDLIKESEFGIRYYNISKGANGFPKGNKPWNTGKENVHARGKRFYNNGNQHRMLYEGEQPEGWKLGRINKPWNAGLTVNDDKRLASNIERMRNTKKGKSSNKKGRSHEEIYGKEKSQKIRKVLSEKLKGRSYEEMMGLEKAEERKKKFLESMKLKKMLKKTKV